MPFLPRLIVALGLVAAIQAPSSSPVIPPNEAAELRIDGDTIRLRYQGTLIFEGRISNPEAVAAVTPSVARSGGAVDQAIAFYARRLGPALELQGAIAASDEAFPVESDRPNVTRPVVRHSSGLSRSLLNQAVYDRRWDWVLSVDDQPRTTTRVTPASDGADGRTFALEARGSDIVLRFRPRFYQQHRGLRSFEPWTYGVWPKPIVGWCSWFAFFDKVTEHDIKRAADVMSEVLAPYGYEYLQVDDGYQQATGLPDLWLTANDKFPGGLAALAEYIKERGLKPGIWTNATFSQTEYADAHEEWFVLDGERRVARGNWVDHPVDATAPGALEALVRPIYRGLRTQGWEYFKLDALRHLRYEGYNSHREHFTQKSVDPGDALRRYVESVRDEVGRDRFLLACWGVRPELVGLVDGCRLGTDGFSYAGLAQYNSFNNVVWRNDPDHIELSNREAWRSTMVTSLTGSLFLLTDKPERYLTPFVEPAKRAAPVLVTMPGQLYDVDPSRSSMLARVDSEVSGRDPKPFDAGLTPAVDLYLLEINRPFDSWVVLGRTGGTFDRIAFGDLGLDPKRRYLVFEFWQKQFVGSFTEAFVPGALPAINAQAFIIREAHDRPQLVATSRHITGGGVELLDLSWQDGVLSGRSRLVGGDPYEIYLTEPAGWTIAKMECDGANPLPIERVGGLVKAGCRAERSADVAWRAGFEKRGHSSFRDSAEVDTDIFSSSRSQGVHYCGKRKR